MKVVVTGGSGHIGTYLVPMLVRAGYEVWVVARGQSLPYVPDAAWDKVERARLDRTKEPRFAELVADMRPDIVVDLISFSLEEAAAMAAALSGARLSHYLFCSSIWAHGRAETLPFNPDDLDKKPLCQYGREKFRCELHLKERFRQTGFPATIIMPGQISGPGWGIISPYGNADPEVFGKIARGETIYLPNLGMETIHHVHGEDVAQLFFKAIARRNQALGESFHAVSGQSITLYGYARLMFEFFSREPRIEFLPWESWREKLGDEEQAEISYFHLARSGYFDISKEEKLLGYRPKYTNVDTIKIAVTSYLDRGVLVKDS